MARMKFICDAERCIECNGCLLACRHLAAEVTGERQREREVE